MDKKYTGADLVEEMNKDEYAFLREMRNRDELVILTFGGSIAHGTNIEGSDVDIRGIIKNPIESLLGIDNNFEQYDDRLNGGNTDTVLYTLNKMLKLLMECNPSIIEMLGMEDDMYAYISEEGKLLLENKDLFLSKRAIRSFGGYASGQLNRLNNNVARHRGNKEVLNENIGRSIDRVIEGFNGRYKDYDKVDFNIEIVEDELSISGNMKGLRVEEFKSMTQDIANTLREYNKINHRGKKKTDAKLSKHMMHLIRLYTMGYDIVKYGIIKTRRKDDELKMLMDIRNGKYLDDDGMPSKEFYELTKFFSDRFFDAADNSKLPDKCDTDKVNELAIKLNKITLDKNGN